MPPRRAPTPGRTTRASSRAPGPLPAVATRQSHAYGAAGKASLNAQVTSSHADIDQAFEQTQYEEPPVPESVPEPVFEPKPRKRHPQKSPESQPNGVHPDGVAVTDFAGIRPSTRLGDTGYLRAPPPPRARAQPSNILVFVATAMKFIHTWQFWAFIGLSWITFVTYLCTFGVIFTFTKLPTAEMAAQRDVFVYHLAKSIGYQSTLVPPDDREKQLLQNRYFFYELQDVKTNFTRVSNTTNELSSQIGLLGDSVAELQRILPHTVVLVDDNGDIAIPSGFWSALVDKMKSDEASTLWESFLHSNEEKMEDLMRSTVGSEVDGMAEKLHLLPRDEFQALLASNNNLMEEHFNETLRAFQTMVLEQAKQTAQDVAEDIFDRSNQLGKGTYSFAISLEINVTDMLQVK